MVIIVMSLKVSHAHTKSFLFTNVSSKKRICKCKYYKINVTRFTYIVSHIQELKVTLNDEQRIWTLIYFFLAKEIKAVMTFWVMPFFLAFVKDNCTVFNRSMIVWFAAAPRKIGCGFSRWEPHPLTFFS